MLLKEQEIFTLDGKSSTPLMLIDFNVHSFPTNECIGFT